MVTDLLMDLVLLKQVSLKTGPPYLGVPAVTYQPRGWMPVMGSIPRQQVILRILFRAIHQLSAPSQAISKMREGIQCMTPYPLLHPPLLFQVRLVIQQCYHRPLKRRFQPQSSGNSLRSDARIREGLDVPYVELLSRQITTLPVCIHPQLCIPPAVANDATFRKIILTRTLVSSTRARDATATLALFPP